ncbi:MAG: hypothetical protein N3D84_01220 [Candidatus Woesearchaeota archaeon]|nr:hypothetical protein [Candidatus Woesearchaeota archaeon]
MKSKKSLELSMNTIIIAVIALIVLVVVILIFTGQIGKAKGGLNKTQTTYSEDTCKIPGTSNECRTEAQCAERGGVNYGKKNDCFFGQICCSE